MPDAEQQRQAGAVESCLGGNAPCYVWPGIDVRYTSAIALAESCGYAPCGDAFNLDVDLSRARIDTRSDEKRLSEAGVSVRHLTAHDLPRFSAWAEEQWGPEWAWEATRALRLDGAGCYVATRGDAFVAFAAYGCARPSWFGPMGTVRSERKQGLGAVLLRRCLADARAGGMSHYLIAWAGPQEFYRRTVGAVASSSFRLYRKAL